MATGLSLQRRETGEARNSSPSGWRRPSTDGSLNANSWTKNDIVWKSEDSCATRVYIPGVDMNCNKRARKVKWQPCKEVHFKSPLLTNSRHNLISPQTDPMSSDPKTSRLSGKLSASTKLSDDANSAEDHSKVLLKDLCHEDKLRVANLILELAKLGDERDNVKEQLNKERGNFEVQIQRLTDQLKTLTDDHKQILCKMMDCQHLLSIYQHILTEIQDQKRNPKSDQNLQEIINTKENVQHRTISQQPVFKTHECVSNQGNHCNLPSDICVHHSKTATMSLSRNNSNISNPQNSNSLNIHSSRRLPHHKKANLVSHVARKDLRPAKYIFKTSPRDEPQNCANGEIPRERSLKDIREASAKSTSSQKGLAPSEMNYTEECTEDLAGAKINISKTREPVSLHAEEMVTSKDHLEKPKSKCDKLNERRLFGPLQEPIMSSTQRSSEFAYSGSVCSQNTVANAVNAGAGHHSFRSAFSLPETLHSYKRLAHLNFSDTSHSRNNIYNNYAKHKTSSLRSSLHSLPNVLLQAAPSRNTDLTNKAVLSDKTNEGELHNTSLQSNASKTSHPDLLANNLNAAQFCQMDFEERRQFLVKQRELLNEERNRLMSILNHPDIKPLQLNSISNRKNSIPELSFTSQAIPISCQDKENSCNISEDTEEASLKSEIVSKEPCDEVVSDSNLGEVVTKVNSEDCCSVSSQSSSKQSSLCLADLIDSIESDLPLAHKQHFPKKSHRLSPKLTKPFQSEKLEEICEREILKDVFFLN
ncbi:uncharacterized protein LOC115221559 isoform X2 [Octopus sinensis]|uniref:Uncharacterized protein LOC115221559 isoform X2 n=1 Tax=Octopus sinensis TaxID=2607531 RepID=A0A7E6FGW2_9MOLL|nr:uncharacterized protein LOC115221559 isoform X2 [Octopus sinensis]